MTCEGNIIGAGTPSLPLSRRVSPAHTPPPPPPLAFRIGLPSLPSLRGGLKARVRMCGETSVDGGWLVCGYVCVGKQVWMMDGVWLRMCGETSVVGVWLRMCGYVCAVTYVWLRMCGWCVVMYVWLRMCGYVLWGNKLWMVLLRLRALL